MEPPLTTVEVYLPPEIIGHIYSFMPIEDKRAGRQVCKSWNFAISEHVKFVIRIDQFKLTRNLTIHLPACREFSVVVSNLPYDVSDRITRSRLEHILRDCSKLAIGPGVFPRCLDLLLGLAFGEKMTTIVFNFQSMERFTEYFPQSPERLAWKLSARVLLRSLHLQVDTLAIDRSHVDVDNELDTATRLVAELHSFSLKELGLHFKTGLDMTGRMADRLDVLVVTAILTIRTRSPTIERLVMRTNVCTRWYDMAVALLFSSLRTVPHLRDVQLERIFRFPVSFRVYASFFREYGHVLRVQHICKVSPAAGRIRVFGSYLPHVVCTQVEETGHNCGLRVTRL